MLQKKSTDKHLTPLKISNLNSKNFAGSNVYFGTLMTELNTLVKSRENESEIRRRGLHFSHENLDSEKVCSLPRPKTPTLIRPQLTNPKVFWSKFEDENLSSGSKNFKNSYLEEKVITNFFRPIRSEISPGMSNVKTGKNRGKKKEESSGKVDKSIHESLRIQKVKRRTSLPFFWNDDSRQELIPAVEKVQTYDSNYYSSILKRINQEKSQYYSSTRKNGSEMRMPMKSVSDERIYGEKQNKPFREFSVKSERVSVTEPSSPLTCTCFVQANRRAGISDSEMESESTGSDVIVEVKKSKSFIDEKEADGYFKTKSQPKTGTQGLSKTSQSSSSSCDSAYKTRSLRMCPKNKSKNEVRYSSNFEYNPPVNQSYESQRKKYWLEMSEKDATMYKKVLDAEAVKRERSQSLNRDSRRNEDLQKMKENVFKHLIETLMQKNRFELINEKQKGLFSKSLPRNTMRWKNDKYEEECLKVLRSVLEKEAKNQQFKSFDRKYYSGKKISQTEDFVLDARQRRKKTNEVDSEFRGGSGQRLLMRNVAEKQKSDNILEAISKKTSSKGKCGTNLNDECVFAIENKKLWIEICRAVEKVDVKGKVTKKCA